MGFKPKINVQLFTCDTCHKRYNNPATHVCVIRLDKKAQGAARSKPARRKKK